MVLKQTEILAAKKLTAGQTGLKVVKLPTRGEKDVDDTRTMLAEAVVQAIRSECDGAIVILTKGKKAVGVKVGGLMVEGEAALMQLQRLVLSIVVDHDDF